ncbi:hypothetical protein IL992_25115 [Microbispora sp. NEAU-D428]|uniref:XF1762 family protein n=1 Tax=Microbispora sitophila TaxID=2771537 RepID=UPI001865BFD6|nr:XF1762 family protein [Microbispora sitophila]MBE3012448.1 hypothetical protein [Microbispora sitophila]
MCGFVAMWHRYLELPRGHKWCFGVADDLGVLRGVVIVGRPMSHVLDDGMTLEVTRSGDEFGDRQPRISASGTFCSAGVSEPW